MNNDEKQKLKEKAYAEYRKTRMLAWEEYEKKWIEIDAMKEE